MNPLANWAPLDIDELTRRLIEVLCEIPSEQDLLRGFVRGWDCQVFCVNGLFI